MRVSGARECGRHSAHVAGWAMYHAAKHGVIGLTRRVRPRICVQRDSLGAVSLGIVETPMLVHIRVSGGGVLKEMIKEQPIGPLGWPEEIAAAVLWLCSPDASSVIGHALAVNDGYTAR